MHKWLPERTPRHTTDYFVYRNNRNRMMVEPRRLSRRSLPFEKKRLFSKIEKQDKKFEAAAEVVQKFYGKPLYDTYVVDKSEFPWHARLSASAFVSRGDCRPYMSFLWRPKKSTIAHELAHAQDCALIGEKLKEARQRIPIKIETLYMEGRGLFIGAKAGSKAIPVLFYGHLAANLLVVPAFATAMAGTLIPPLGDAIASLLQPLKSALEGIRAIHMSPAVYWTTYWASLLPLIPLTYISVKHSLTYLAFYHSLRRIERKVGDAATAYKITSEKIPQTLRDILSPMKFYKDGIAAAMAKKNEKPDC